MICVYCGNKTRIINSRPSEKGYKTWRRHQCKICRAIFTTVERPDLRLSVMVKTSNSSLKPFIYEELWLDMYKSLSHRKMAYTDATELTGTIISRLIPAESGSIESREIKQAAVEVLKRFDKTALSYFTARH